MYDKVYQKPAPKLSDEEIEKMALEYIATGKEPKAQSDEVKKIAKDILNGKHFGR